MKGVKEKTGTKYSPSLQKSLLYHLGRGNGAEPAERRHSAGTDTFDFPQTMIRKVTHFFGHVQGVGFRYTTRSLAGGFAVTGCVRNLRNGSVELIAEGDAGEIERLLATLREQMSGYIDREETAESPATGTFAGFEIQ